MLRGIFRNAYNLRSIPGSIRKENPGRSSGNSDKTKIYVVILLFHNYAIIKSLSSREIQITQI